MSVIAILNKIELEMISNITESYHLNVEIAFSGSQVYVRSNDNMQLSSYFSWNNHNWFPVSLVDHGFCYVADLGNLDLKFNKIGSTNSVNIYFDLLINSLKSLPSYNLTCCDGLDLYYYC